MAAEPGTPLPMAPALPFEGDVSPCQRFACRFCCFDTEMQLVPEDVHRLEQATGLAAAEFTVHDLETDETRLANHGGRCVFLGERGCTVYADRPAGCRLYPLVYDMERSEGTLDDDCPYRAGFRATDEAQKALTGLVRSLLG